MAHQRITIVVGDKGRVLPEDIARALGSIPDTLRSIDANMWNIPHPRFEWYVEEATTNSPFTIVLIAALAIKDAPPVDVVSAFMQGVRQLNQDKPVYPKFWSPEDVKRTGQLQQILEHQTPLVFKSDTETVTLSAHIGDSAKLVLERAVLSAGAPVYGSLTGSVRQVTVEVRDNVKPASKFQLFDRDTDAIVDCAFPAVRAKDFHATDRVTVYGEITYHTNGKPKSMRVEDFRVLPDRLPLLRDLHELRLNITGGEDAADFVDRLRGDLDDDE